MQNILQYGSKHWLVNWKSLHVPNTFVRIEHTVRKTFPSKRTVLQNPNILTAHYSLTPRSRPFYSYQIPHQATIFSKGDNGVLPIPYLMALHALSKRPFKELQRLSQTPAALEKLPDHAKSILDNFQKIPEAKNIADTLPPALPLEVKKEIEDEFFDARDITPDEENDLDFKNAAEAANRIFFPPPPEPFALPPPPEEIFAPSNTNGPEDEHDVFAPLPPDDSDDVSPEFPKIITIPPSEKFPNVINIKKKDLTETVKNLGRRLISLFGDAIFEPVALAPDEGNEFKKANKMLEVQTFVENANSTLDQVTDRLDVSKLSQLGSFLVSAGIEATSYLIKAVDYLVEDDRLINAIGTVLNGIDRVVNESRELFAPVPVPAFREIQDEPVESHFSRLTNMITNFSERLVQEEIKHESFDDQLKRHIRERKLKPVQTKEVKIKEEPTVKPSPMDQMSAAFDKMLQNRRQVFEQARGDDDDIKQEEVDWEGEGIRRKRKKKTFKKLPRKRIRGGDLAAEKEIIVPQQSQPLPQPPQDTITTQTVNKPIPIR